jgi:hypothetical protein
VIKISRCSYCKKQGETKKTAIRIWNKGKPKTTELDYCSDSCKQNIRDFVKSHNKYAPKYAGIALLWLLFFLVIPFSLKAITGDPVYVNVGSPAMIALMGAILIRFPLGLSSTRYYERLGIKYTTMFIRLSGFLMLFSGVNMLWVYFK